MYPLEDPMKLTLASTYALHAVAHMVAQNKDAPLASQKIAEKEGIPERFLLKVLKPLVGAQVLRSMKGPNGGYRLAKPLSAINVLEIIEAVDGPIRGQVPFQEGGRNAALDQQLVSICNEAAGEVRKVLQGVRVVDLVDKKAKKSR